MLVDVQDCSDISFLGMVDPLAALETARKLQERFESTQMWLRSVV